MPDRQIDYGEDATDATYRSGDAGGTTGGGNFVVVEDLDAGTVLFEWDPTAGEFVSRGPIDLSGNNLSGVSTVSATDLEASNAITDAAGVTHTGELADIDDVGGGGSGYTQDYLIDSAAITKPPLTGSHTGFSVPIHAAGTLYIVYRSSSNHGFDSGSELRVIESPNNGRTWENDRALDTSSTDVFPRSGRIMGNGRLGVQCTMRTGSDTFDPMGFLYSDDDGATWTLNTTSLPSGYNWTSDITPYPASVGGDDTAGFIVYTHDETDKYIRGATTTDNGDSWTFQDNLITESGPWNTEPTVARVGDQDKWIMYIRDNSNTGLDMRATTSTDLLNWEPTVSTGVTLGKNRPKAIGHGGVHHIITTSRAYRGPEIDSFGDSIVYTRVDAEEQYNDLTSVSYWNQIADGETGNLGYPSFTRTGGQFLIGAGLNEAGDNSSSDWGLWVPDTLNLEGNTSSTSSSRQHAFSHLTTDTSVSANTEVQLTFDSVVEDSDTIYDTGTGEFTIQEDGVYNIEALVRVNDLAENATSQLQINKNSGARQWFNFHNGEGGNITSIPISATEAFTSGDVITCEFKNASGSSVTVAGGATDGSNIFTYMSVSRVSE